MITYHDKSPIVSDPDTLFWASFFIPGLGQFMSGRFFWGLFYLLGSILVWWLAWDMPAIAGGIWPGILLSLNAAFNARRDHAVTGAATFRGRRMGFPDISNN